MMKRSSWIRFAGRTALVTAMAGFAGQQATYGIVLSVDDSGVTTDNMDIDDGQSDIFDDGMTLFVNGSLFNAGASFVDAEPSFFGAETIGDIRVERRVLGIDSNGIESNSEETDYTYVRYLDTFTNTTGSPVTIDVDYDNDMGSDSDNAIQTETGGFGADLDTDDRWFIHGNNDEDPVVGWVLHDGTLAPTSASASGVSDFDDGDSDDGDEDIGWAFNFDLAPGETKTLMTFLTARNGTDTFLFGDGKDIDARGDLEVLLGIDLPGSARSDPSGALLGAMPDTTDVGGFMIDERFLAGIGAELGGTIINFSDLTFPDRPDRAIPEPLTGGLALLGLSALAAWRRRSHRA